jgi:hypothetical protein
VKQSAKRAIVIGGSVSGLLSACLLHPKGSEVDIFERSTVELKGRCAGIVSHDELLGVLTSYGADLQLRRAAGRSHFVRPVQQDFTNAAFSTDRNILGPYSEHRSGSATPIQPSPWPNVYRLRSDARGLVAHFAGGRSERGDLLSAWMVSDLPCGRWLLVTLFRFTPDM